MTDGGLYPEIVLTERLRLEASTPDFVDPMTVYEHCRAGAPDIEEITEEMPWEPHETPKESHDGVQSSAEGRSSNEGLGFVVRPRAGEAGAGEFAGLCGMSLDWEHRSSELGIWLRKPFWGRGYSGERAMALASLAFDRLDLEVLSVTHTPDNEQSERAITKYVERMGGRREGTCRNFEADPDGPVDLVRYTVSQTEWEDAALDPDVTFYDAALDANFDDDGDGDAEDAPECPNEPATPAARE